MSPTPHLTVEQRQLARRLSAKGLSLREVARQYGVSRQSVHTWLARYAEDAVRLLHGTCVT